MPKPRSRPANRPVIRLVTDLLKAATHLFRNRIRITGAKRSAASKMINIAIRMRSTVAGYLVTLAGGEVKAGLFCTHPSVHTRRGEVFAGRGRWIGCARAGGA